VKLSFARLKMNLDLIRVNFLWMLSTYLVNFIILVMI